MVEPRTNSIRDEVFLGKTSGKIIKQTEIPALIVPEGYKFSPINNILLAVKSAIIKKEKSLNPLTDIKNTFNAVVNLLLVKTPYYNEGDFDVDKKIKTSSYTILLRLKMQQHFKVFYRHLESHKPDMLCVVRRKRGFFTKKWEKNVILKKDFSSLIPVLVLQGLK